MNELTALMLAARRGDVDTIKALIMEDAKSVHATDAQGRSALHHAVEASQHGSLRLLLQTDPGLATLKDSDGRNVLHLATVAGEIELIKELVRNIDIDSVDNEKHTALHFATVSGLYNCIELLIEKGADPMKPDVHGAYPVHYAAQMCGDPTTANTGVKCLEALLIKGGSDINSKDGGGKTPLLWAASAGSSDACKLLIERGADVKIGDNDGLTAVHCATSRNKTTCLKTLLEECGCKTDRVDNKGCTALFYAIMMDYRRCVKMLLTYGASTSWQDLDGRSPMHCAASTGSIRYLKMLRKHRGHLELPTSSGDRPIHAAARDGHNDVVKFLLKRGAGINVRNNDGLTALHIAAETDNLALCKDLVNQGADLSAIYNSSKSNHVTPETLATESGCHKCAEYLKYANQQETPHRREQISSNDDSSSSEEEKEEKIKDENKENVKPKNEDVERVKSPNTNNNNSPNTSSVEDDESRDDGTPSTGVTYAEVHAAPIGAEGTGKKDDRKNESKLKEKVMQDRKVKSAGGRVDLSLTNEVPSFDPDRLQNRIADWDAYIKENVDFLETVIQSKSPALEEIRKHAKFEMKILVEKLETLKKEIDDGCQQLVDKMTNREKQRQKEYETMMKKWEESEAKFKKSQDKIDKAVNNYRARNKEFQEQLAKIEAKEAKEEETKLDRAKSAPAGGDDDKIVRQKQHKSWVRERNSDYLRKKHDIHLKFVFEHTVQSIRAKRSFADYTSLNRNASHTIPSSRSPISSRLKPSPFSRRTIDQCPVYKKSQHGSEEESNEVALTSYEKAQLRRSVGDQLKQTMYPKSWEMATEKQDPHNPDNCIPRWDGGIRPKSKLQFRARTPQTRRIRSASAEH